ncbi:hypothetical protein CE91St41_14630 [Oscillospiraceae bacterium]|nr:hypothetical protein CE91St40_22910 [Oscillospiraceae bacterium]BDF74574.1 hypothetical protein CE91St41_14630 [Oscillospiraceae bacterium]
MDKKLKISDAEMEVLRTLWAPGPEWRSVADVCAALEGRGWKYKTVGTFLLRLAEKGAAVTQKEGKVNCYRPAFSEAEYKRLETEEFLRCVHGGSARSLLAALYGEAADGETLDRLEQWLKER